MSLRKALLAATMLTLPVAAQAQPMDTRVPPVSGLYVGAGAGFNVRHVSDSRGIRIVSDNPGFAGVGSIGWGFGNGLRAEIEGNYRDNSVDKLTTVRGAPPVRSSSGYIHSYGAMGNVLFDVNIPYVPLATYFGVGAGYIWNEIENSRFTRGATTYRIDDIGGNFAYQAIAGTAFNIAAVPGLAITLEYRFLGTLEPKLSIDRIGGPPRNDIGPGFKPDNYNHSALLGVRYNFGQARPMPAAEQPPAPPPPAVARTYLVFFDWDRADLTERARQIIAEAANASRTASATRIDVAGHADRSGTVQYNQRLSRRRADAVAAELVRQGVSRNDIGITAYGESRPLVPTADGVREPQNRRVEIVLR